MESLSSLRQNFNIELNYLELATNLLIAALLASIVEYIFRNYSNSINNKKTFSKNFILIVTINALS